MMLTLFRLLDEISVFLQGQISAGFLQLLYSKDERISMIEGYHRRISAIADAFQVSLQFCFTFFIYSFRSTRWCQISALVEIQAWHAKDKHARIADQLILNERLGMLEANQMQLMKALGTSYCQDP